MRRPHFTATIRGATTDTLGDERVLDLVHGSDRVPATFLVPAHAPPLPGALLIHGFSSNKERMSHSVGRALAKLGVASLSIDLPFHGERNGGGGEIPYRNPLALVAAWRAAAREARAAVGWLADQSEVDGARIGIVGYSLGGYLALMTAADESQIRVVTLAAAGDLPDATPYAAMVRRAVDPVKAVRKLKGRPLLLVNGRRDHTTRPAQAERLFSVAEEPKQLSWYDGGHWPPQSAIDHAAEWTAVQLRGLTERAGRRQAG